MNVLNDPIITNAPMNTDIDSPPISLPNIFGYAVQAEIVGTILSGTLKIQVSCDPAPQGPPNLIVPTNWTDIGCSAVTVISSGDITWNVSDVFYTWMRVVYLDNTSGASDGVLNARIVAKGM